MYISITGLKPRNFFTTIRFWIFTIPAFRAAQKSEGNLFCEAKKKDSYYHTITAWKNRGMMIKYLTGKDHSKAMKNFSLIGTGSTYGYEGEQIPSWNKAIKIWKENFKEV
ncbi:hypothetical protein OAW36_01310 [Pelagibacteraceae bacterium]|jgi:hypothetical protein|nr:hypothetical protein [Pelagibacteraceae bacterium]